MIRPEEIQRLMRKKGEANWKANIVYSLMVNCNQQYSEIRRMPIPIVLKLLKKIEEEQKEMEKKSKPKKGRTF